jgi:hypothetical protein
LNNNFIWFIWKPRESNSTYSSIAIILERINYFFVISMRVVISINNVDLICIKDTEIIWVDLWKRNIKNLKGNIHFLLKSISILIINIIKFSCLLSFFKYFPNRLLLNKSNTWSMSNCNYLLIRSDKHF